MPVKGGGKRLLTRNTLLLLLPYAIITTWIVLAGIVQTITARGLADDEMGRSPAFKIHGSATVGMARIPGDEIELAFSANDALVWLHGDGLFKASLSSL